MPPHPPRCRRPAPSPACPCSRDVRVSSSLACSLSGCKAFLQRCTLPVGVAPSAGAWLPSAQGVAPGGRGSLRPGRGSRELGECRLLPWSLRRPSPATCGLTERSPAGRLEFALRRESFVRKRSTEDTGIHLEAFAHRASGRAGRFVSRRVFRSPDTGSGFLPRAGPHGAGRVASTDPL